MRDHAPRWDAVPPELGAVLAGPLESITADVLEAVRDQVPLYARPLTGAFGRGIELGTREALRQFCGLITSGGAAEAGGLVVYEQLGRGEWRQGRPLDALLSAYRVGARVAWRRFALIGAEAGLDTGGLVALAELVFAHIDELSSASADGYAAEQSEGSRERERRQAALARLLLAGGGDAADREAAAALAAFPLPGRLRVVLAPAGTPLGPRLGPRALVLDEDPVTAVLGDPPPGPRLARLLAGTGAVVGPETTPENGPVSAARAAALLRLRRHGRVRAAAEEVLLTDDHLVTLLLAADPGVADDLAAAVLAGLDTLPAPTRVRLQDTLRAWLLHAGERGAAAASLHVHPQTVRYRMTQVRELLGGAVDDPAQRLGLLLALELRHQP